MKSTFIILIFLFINSASAKTITLEVSDQLFCDKESQINYNFDKSISFHKPTLMFNGQCLPITGNDVSKKGLCNLLNMDFMLASTDEAAFMDRSYSIDLNEDGTLGKISSSYTSMARYSIIQRLKILQTITCRPRQQNQQ